MPALKRRHEVQYLSLSLSRVRNVLSFDVRIKLSALSFAGGDRRLDFVTFHRFDAGASVICAHNDSSKSASYIGVYTSLFALKSGNSRMNIAENGWRTRT